MHIAKMIRDLRDSANVPGKCEVSYLTLACCRLVTGLIVTSLERELTGHQLIVKHRTS